MKICCKFEASTIEVEVKPSSRIAKLKEEIWTRLPQSHKDSYVALQLKVVRVHSAGNNTSGVLSSTDFTELVQAVRAAGEKVEDFTSVGSDIPGWVWNSGTVGAKVMNGGGTCKVYGLKRSSPMFIVDVLVIVPCTTGTLFVLDVRNPEVLVSFVIQILGNLVKNVDSRGRYEDFERLADNKLGGTINRQSTIQKFRSYIEDPPFRAEDLAYGIAATWGAPGAGKSHLLDMIARYHALGPYVPLPVSFNGKTMGEVYGVRGLYIRLLLAYFVGVPSIDRNKMQWDFSDIASILDQKLPENLKLGNVLKAIRYDYSQNHDCEAESIKVMILVDEVGKPPHNAEDIATIYRDIVKNLTSVKLGVVFTALDGTQILPQRFEGATTSSRPVDWLDLPALPTTTWEILSENEGDYVSARLYSMTGGHPRTIQYLNYILHRRLNFNPKLKLNLLLSAEVMQEVAKNLQCESVEIFYWLVPAILCRVMTLKNRDGTPTEFSLGIAKGALINTPAEFAEAVPQLSLFTISKAAHELMNSNEYYRHAELLNLIVALLSSPLDGFRFEEFHAYREALYLLLLLEEKFSDYVSITNDLYRGCKLVSGRQVDVKCHYWGAISVNEQFLTPEQSWTVNRIAGCNRNAVVAKKIYTIPFGTVVLSEDKLTVGFDLVVFHEETSNPPKPHLLLLECKYSSDQSSVKLNIKDIKSKFALINSCFETLFTQPSNQQHPFIASGIKSFSQITFIFVAHRDMTSSLYYQAEEYLKVNGTHERWGTMNVALIGVDELCKLYGPTLSSAMGFLST
ncbi:hypothetical protein HK096_004907 [Nowakowskiella sp. JEL0078]|nr:hypothetical protein HK096_004907 [Nowakowskiella sp. JEL0078]